MSLLSIVVPCYNEQETVALFYAATDKVLKTMELDYEIIYVNDGSKDATLQKCIELQQQHPDCIKVIDFSRNFGKEGALLAGLEHAKGDYITVMDADLQDPPEYLPKMFELINQGYDIVGTRRVSRQGEPPIRSFFARQFYKLINRFTEVEIVDGARDYRLMTRQVVDAILSLKEYHRFSKGLFVWVGFKTKYLEYENVERVAGETSWSFWGLLKYAIEGIIAFTIAPLRIATFMGIIISFIAFCSLIFVVGRALIFGDPVDGWPSMVSIMLFLGGIQLLALGIIGEYLSKTYMEVKKRPNYIIKKVYEEGGSYEQAS
ncbi:MAG: glycosyltransferase family 2 protein [Erysipelotrichaceae bacterium]|nr:glycosyltransferase family 2 protein [Erysipelotrichaceae bacterium]